MREMKPDIAVLLNANSQTLTGTDLPQSLSEPEENEPSTQQPPDAVEVAVYIADMLTELSRLADKSKHKFLAYLIEVATEEAKIQARRGAEKPKMWR